MSDKKSFVERPVFVFLVAAVGFFLLSFLAMGIAPWLTILPLAKDQTAIKNPYLDDDGSLNAIGRGRNIYIQEGCWHCHSQFVRPVAGEPFRYGPPSQHWESLFDVPQTFGTRRIGPDLAREAGRRTDDWHLAHLYDPRSVVPVSVMPGYPWLFEKDHTPKQDALDLVAYLQNLGIAYAEEVKDIVYPRPVKVVGPVKYRFAASDRGRELFGENCSGCHGVNGDGGGTANGFLRPRAINLSSRYMAVTEVFATLNSGVRGTSMPSFHEMPEKDLWALSVFVNELGSDVKKAWQESKQSPSDVSKGKATYETYCVSCHGIDGNPPEAIQTSLQPPPRVFAKRLFTDKLLFEVLRDGRDGTSMPPFPDISEEAAKEINAYLSTMFVEDPQ